MFSYFESNLIEKFLWESGFSHFGGTWYFRETKNLFLILVTIHFLTDVLFADLWFS